MFTLIADRINLNPVTEEMLCSMASTREVLRAFEELLTASSHNRNLLCQTGLAAQLLEMFEMVFLTQEVHLVLFTVI